MLVVRDCSQAASALQHLLLVTRAECESAQSFQGGSGARSGGLVRSTTARMPCAPCSHMLHTLITQYRMTG